MHDKMEVGTKVLLGVPAGLFNAQVFYRVTLVVEYLGWVDLDLGYSTILLGQ